MNIFKTKLGKKLTEYSFKIGYVNWLPKFFHLLPENWTDNQGNNLFHFAARYHNEEIFQFALLNKANINAFDIHGNAPIHRFIEASFAIKDNSEDINVENNDVKNNINTNSSSTTSNSSSFSNTPMLEKEKEKNKDKNSFFRFKKNKRYQYYQEFLSKSKQDGNIYFEYNEKLLDMFIEEGSDINLWMKYDERDGQWGKNVVTFSRKNIMGSPIELLIMLFWDNVLFPTDFNDEAQLEKYHKMYKTLSKAGAKINLLVETGQFYNIEKEKTLDAMQDTGRFIVSHFFAKYIINDKDIEAVLPLLDDPSLDFKLMDDTGNTILHNVFGRISSRLNCLTDVKILKIIWAILNNPSFKKEDLYITNNFRLSAIKCFKGKSVVYAEMIDKVMLSRKLNEDLTSNKLNEIELHLDKDDEEKGGSEGKGKEKDESVQSTKTRKKVNKI